MMYSLATGFLCLKIFYLSSIYLTIQGNYKTHLWKSLYSITNVYGWIPQTSPPPPFWRYILDFALCIKVNRTV